MRLTVAKAYIRVFRVLCVFCVRFLDLWEKLSDAKGFATRVLLLPKSRSKVLHDPSWTDFMPFMFRLSPTHERRGSQAAAR